MDIQDWFAKKGNYSDGLMLYSRLPNCNSNMLRNLQNENPANFLKLKYELKKASINGVNAIVPKVEKIAPEPKKEVKPEPLLESFIKKSADVSFEKETMAMYPHELHSTYSERISNFYKACELKFQLNAVPARQDDDALKIIIQLEDLWTRIDRAWMILDHWKDHNRIMPVKESEDFTALSPVKIVLLRNNLEAKISGRQKTIESLSKKAQATPEDRSLSNSLNRKLEQLQQLKIDLETIRNILKNE